MAYFFGSPCIFTIGLRAAEYSSVSVRLGLGLDLVSGWFMVMHKY